MDEAQDNELGTTFHLVAGLHLTFSGLTLCQTVCFTKSVYFSFKGGTFCGLSRVGLFPTFPAHVYRLKALML